jgi:23S rRNA (guanine745-N1)-methyltransferase
MPDFKQQLLCPHCRASLAKQAPRSSSLTCANHHSFDVAREGFVNLLPGEGSRGFMGDSLEMLQARRRFLGAGHYAPLTALLAGKVASLLGSNAAARSCFGSLCVLEVGCGEGHHLAGVRDHLVGLRDHLKSLGAPLSFWGMDLSRDGVRLATRHGEDLQLFVADLKAGLPMVSGSVSLLLDIFAPRNPEEFARLVAPGGSLLVVIPAPDHLQEGREPLGLIGIQEEKQAAVAEQMGNAFSPVSTESLRIPLKLQGSDLADLVAMTPNHHHADAEQVARIGEQGGMALTASFILLEYRRKVRQRPRR